MTQNHSYVEGQDPETAGVYLHGAAPAGVSPQSVAVAYLIRFVVPSVASFPHMSETWRTAAFSQPAILGKDCSEIYA